MLLKYETLESHLDQELAPLYILTGDEPLLLLESADQIRQAARRQHVIEREVMTVERGFKWGQLHAANNAMSLFGDRKFIELRIPGGKPGKEGSQALQEYVAARHTDNITLITLPRLDMATRKSAWVTALQKNGIYIEIPTIDLSRLGNWIIARLKKQHQSASRQCIDFLMERVEGNLLAAHQEILKLGLLYPEGELDFEQVRQSVLNVARYDIFKLNEAMLSGNRSRFIRMMEGLKGEGEPLPLILWTFTEEIRTLLKCKIALENGQSFSGIAKTLRLWGPRERLMQAAVNRLDKQDIRTALQQTAQIDRIIKGLHSASWMDDAWDALTQLGLSLAHP
ncbi:DNA polymerase III subunit delta [Oxalobacter sp. OxGP1]|uniref:DNA polymerase III subunit delta n=1 Tax=Oxalobacter paeniformigenes TaxID=2946594 RepID=UPI0022B05ECA|nr:DNA polymerase III subunit delta [Oxalobacter paeniformigenes]MCZ4053505.1 DNA polymerase III subunit delta [Oxalobacter paeniformigenes]